jgi:ubiquinone/menaquinone biosynthesis C-methylase UbiE
MPAARRATALAMETSAERAKHARLQANILEALGHPLQPGATVLDFGCGRGATVAAYRSAGYDAYGCDIALDHETAFLRAIGSPYRLPFSSNAFDFVFSDQVLEHVQDHGAALSEISRVLKPDGLSLHIFPSKFCLVEPHSFVPLAAFLQARWWLWVWATVGIRNSHQKGRPSREVVELNYRFLKTSTKYLSRRRLAHVTAEYFAEVAFVEFLLVQHSYGRSRHLSGLAKRWPGVGRLYGTFHSRVMFLRNGEPNHQNLRGRLPR